MSRRVQPKTIQSGAAPDQLPEWKQERKALKDKVVELLGEFSGARLSQSKLMKLALPLLNAKRKEMFLLEYPTSAERLEDERKPKHRHANNEPVELEKEPLSERELERRRNNPGNKNRWGDLSFDTFKKCLMAKSKKGQEFPTSSMHYA